VYLGWRKARTEEVVPAFVEVGVVGMRMPLVVVYYEQPPVVSKNEFLDIKLYFLWVQHGVRLSLEIE
jgi:hypothetical protein